MKYEKLFEKGKIGRLELRNRVVMTAMGVMLGDWNGCATPEYARFYEERAKGGCGLIIPEFTSVDPDSGHCNRIQLGIYDARQIRSLEDICDAVHRRGVKWGFKNISRRQSFSAARALYSVRGRSRREVVF